MKVLVTGMAGFIGFHLTRRLLSEGNRVVGIDNLNDYYDISLKQARMKELGFDESLTDGEMKRSRLYGHLRFRRLDLCQREEMDRLFAEEHFDAVINLAGQAGVRYSIENPQAYIQSNVVGFLNVLESCRHHPVSHLVYASSSSIYGLCEHIPYTENDMTDTPVSLYAATKKSNELMAHAYSKLYGIAATGLRFFTVYGPWGRPDMAPSIFLGAMLQRRPIRLFNHGNMRRDFTYVDDIVDGISLVLSHPSQKEVPHRVYNIGNGHPVALLDFVKALEQVSGCRAICKMEALQPGDVVQTYADTRRLAHDFGYSPQVGVDEGVKRFYDWYVQYYGTGDTRI